jgi:ABC-2 type transport system permease protein
MKKAFYIMLKEIRDFINDKGDLSFSLLLPVITFALIYGAFGGGNQFNGTAYIVNEDSGRKYSTMLIDQLDEYKGLQLQSISSEEADAKLARSAIYLAVIIPSNFSDNLTAGQPAQIAFKQRGNGGTEGQIITSLVQGAAEQISKNLEVLNNVRSDLVLLGKDASSPMIGIIVDQVMSQEQISPSITIVDRTVGSSPDPVNQFLPGILTMYVLFAVNLTAEALVSERRKGTLDRLLSTRLKMSELFFGKFMAYTARGFVQTTALLALSYAVFHFFTPVSFLEAILLALIFAAAFSAIALIIGSICKTTNQAVWISVFFTMLMVMLAGTFVQISEGTVLGTLSHLSINTYANNAFRAIISHAGTLADVRFDIMVMISVAIVGMVVASLLFRTQKGR